MKIEPSKIIEGFKNDLFPSKEMRKMIDDVSKERLSICTDCPFNTTPGKIKSWSRCGACGCFLKQKTKCLSCNCGIEAYNEDHPTAPLPLKWTAISTKEQEHELKLYLKEKDDSS